MSERYGDPTEKLIDELRRLLLHVPTYHKRLRIAVTPQERDAIQAFMFKHASVDYGRIADVPLVVEDDPTKPELSFVLPVPPAGMTLEKKP